MSLCSHDAEDDSVVVIVRGAVARLRHILLAGAVCRQWHELLRHDDVWKPLCNAANALGAGFGVGLASGWQMLASVKARPECRLSWKQLFLQRARSLNRSPTQMNARMSRACTRSPLLLLQPPQAQLADLGPQFVRGLSPRPEAPARREDFLIGVEVHLIGSRERALLDAENEQLIVAEIRNVMEENYVRSRRRIITTPFIDAKLSALEVQCFHLKIKKWLVELALTHVVEVFGPRAEARGEWIVMQALRLANKVVSAEPTVTLAQRELKQAGTQTRASKLDQAEFVKRRRDQVAKDMFQARAGLTAKVLRAHLREPVSAWSKCTCVACKRFHEQVPAGEPLVSSLVELPKSRLRAESSQLFSFTSSAEGCRELEGDHDYDMLSELTPSISVFLFRKADGKRLELTQGEHLCSGANVNTDDAYYHQGELFGEMPDGDNAQFSWDLLQDDTECCWYHGREQSAVPADGTARSGAVKREQHARFDCTMCFMDRNLMEEPVAPEGLDDAQLDEWWEEHVPQDYEEPKLMLSKLEIRLLPMREIEDWEYDSADGAYRGPPVVEQRTASPTELLTTLQSPAFASRWV